MSLFLAVTAFKDAEPRLVADQLLALTVEHGVEASPIEAETGPKIRTSPVFDDLVDVLLYQSDPGWTVLLWPQYFHLYDVPVGREISARLGTLVSTVHVCEGAYWAHSLFAAGECLDRFASRPDRAAAGAADPLAIRQKWRGQPGVLAEVLGVDPAVVAPYLVHLDLADPGNAKAHEDDRYPLADFWVFTDFWRKLGINYPEAIEDYVLRIELSTDFMHNIPPDPESEL